MLKETLMDLCDEPVLKSFVEEKYNRLKFPITELIKKKYLEELAREFVYDLTVFDEVLVFYRQHIVSMPSSVAVRYSILDTLRKRGVPEFAFANIEMFFGNFDNITNWCENHL